MTKIPLRRVRNRALQGLKSITETFEDTKNNMMWYNRPDHKISGNYDYEVKTILDYT